ncbi:MAG: hypothetical protein ACYSWX_12950 [Planctomycetota bacterium]|jgi:hypothetical protein
MPFALTKPLRRTFVVLAVLLWLGTAYGPVLGAGFHGHDLELLVRAGKWSETEDGFGPRSIGEFEAIEILDVVGDDARGDVGSLLSGLWMVTSLRLWGAFDGRPLGLPSPFFYRVENLALLLLASWGLWRFLKRLFEPWVGTLQAEQGAFAAALMFAVHPLCVPTVSSLAGRSDLVALSLATWTATAFIVGRQERQYVLLVIAGVLALLAGLAGQIALALPVGLAVAEFLSCGRQRPLKIRIRTAVNTLLVYSLCVQLNVALVSLTTGHGWYPAVQYNLWALLEPGAIVAALGNVLSKVGVLCLPSNSNTLGILGIVLASVLFLAALQPAMIAARSAPRLWTATFLWWGLGTSFALLFGLQKPADLATMGDAVSLVPATLVLCAGLGLACTALSGMRRVVLPLALSFGYAVLANGNAQPWAASSRAFADLRKDVLVALEQHPEAEQVVVVEAPRSVLGVDGIEDGLRWIVHPMFTGDEPRTASDLEPLAIRDLPREGFATWVRSPVFADELGSGTLLVYPLGGFESDTERLEEGRSARLLEASVGGPARVFWSENSRSPDLDLDAFGPAVVEITAPVDATGPFPTEARWRAFSEEARFGDVGALWFEAEDGWRALIDAGDSFAWRMGERIARVWFEGGLPTLREARVVDGLPVPQTTGPETVGSSWRFGAPLHPLIERLPEGEWRLRVLTVPGLESRVIPARSGRVGSPLFFREVGRWAEARMAAGESIRWELEYRVGELAALRATGTEDPASELR